MNATPTGWSDDRIMEAYDLIYAVLDDTKPESDMCPILKAVLDGIENAVTALGWERDR